MASQGIGHAAVRCGQRGQAGLGRLGRVPRGQSSDIASQPGGGGDTICESTLVVAQKQTTSEEILLWMTPSEAPKALQASECSELLDPTRANCWISAQHQPGKFTRVMAWAWVPSSEVNDRGPWLRHDLT